MAKKDQGTFIVASGDHMPSKKPRPVINRFIHVKFDIDFDGLQAAIIRKLKQRRGR